MACYLPWLTGRRLAYAALAFWPLWTAFLALAPHHAWAAAEATPLLPLAGIVLIWAPAAAVGARLLPACGLSPRPGQDTLFATLAGLGVLSFAVFALSAAQVLYPVVLGALMTALAAVAAFAKTDLLPASLDLRASLRSLGARPAGRPPGHQSTIMLALLAAFLLLALLGALAPASDNDTLLYHLAAPQRYLDHHGLFYIPENLWTNVPLFTEMLYTLGLGLMNQTLARLFVFSFYLLVLSGAALFCRRHFPQANPLAAALLIGSIPSLAILNSTNLNEFALLAYALGALFAFVNLWREGDPRWLVVVGLLAGCAASVKYTGFLWLVLVPIGAWRLCRRGQASRPWRPIASAAALCLLLPGCWLVRNAVYTGNPVFPLAYSRLDGGGWPPDRAAAYFEHMRHFGYRAQGPWGIVWPVVATAYDHAAFGSRLIGIGPLLLLAMPLPLLHRHGRPRLASALLWLALLLYLAWAVTVQVLRYLLPTLVICSLVIAEAMGRLVDRPPSTPRSTAHLVLIVAAVFHLAWFATVQQKEFAPQQGLLGVRARQQYLSRYVLSYRTVQLANQALRPQDKLLLIGEWRTFYLRVPFEADAGPNEPIILRYLRGASTPEDVARRLRADGFTHLLYDPSSVEVLGTAFGYIPRQTEQEQLLPFLASCRQLGSANLVSLYEIPTLPTAPPGSGTAHERY